MAEEKNHRHRPPEPPPSFGNYRRGPDVEAAVRAARRRNGLRGLPWFFTKQIFAFSLVVALVLVVDFFALAVIATQEEIAESMQPKMLVSIVSANLSEDPQAGTWSLDPKAQESLEANDAWAMLLEGGRAVWEDRVPAAVPRTFTMTEMAMDVHYANVQGYPVFFWDMNDDRLLMVGFSQNSRYDLSLHLSMDAAHRIPLYVLGIFSLDAAILFIYVLLRRLRTRRATVPMAEALGKLADGKPVTVHLPGELAEVGRTINEVSAVIRAKDEARERWIIGVSHDIRTPLSMIIGYADEVVKTPGLPEAARKDAGLIRAQSLRIADLVQDLNTATRLEYDTQPIDVQDVPAPVLLRTMVASYINDRLPLGYTIELFIADDVLDGCFRGDERLFNRAIQNLVQNAVTHNPQGCAITITLIRRGPDLVLTVADDGQGMEPEAMAQLQAKLGRTAVVDGQSAHGLGLVLVKRIAQVHGGSFAIASQPGRGFQATLVLPASAR